MSGLSKQVEHNIRARRLFVQGQRILVAVSGGVDSMVLLHVLHKLAVKYGWRLTLAHLNHQLRGGSSDADERLVRRTAARLGLAVQVERAEVRKYAREQGLSVEMAARKLRHDFLARTAARLRIRRVALAHHADDQVELFFLRLLRGSGGEGLTGMKWKSCSPSHPRVELVRPLLDQAKSALQAYAAEAGVRFREDATNALLDIRRNRIRHQLLPLLRKHYQPAVDTALRRTIEIIGAETDYVTQAALRWLDQVAPRRARIPGPKAAAKAPESSLRFDQLHLAVQRRALQLQLFEAGIVADFDLIERLRIRANKGVSVGCGQRNVFRQPYARSLAKRQRAVRADAESRTGSVGAMPVSLEAIRAPSGIVTVRLPEAEDFNPAAIEVELGRGEGEAEFGGVEIRWQVDSKRPQRRPSPTAGREFFDADRVGPRVRLRHWRPGDRFQPIGMSSPVKLQDFFTNLKVPRHRRRELVIAVGGDGEVFWVEGMRISDRFKLSKRTIHRLLWRWQRL